MLKDIRSAQTTIGFETYIYGAAVGDSSPTRSPTGPGTASRCMCCSTGSATPVRQGRAREDGGRRRRDRALSRAALVPPAAAQQAHPRKVLVVDGRVGFTGGVGIADKSRGDAEGAEHWRDTHFRVRGPGRGEMQSVFNDNWTSATGRVLHGKESSRRCSRCRAASPRRCSAARRAAAAQSMHLMYLLAITAAKAGVDLLEQLLRARRADRPSVGRRARARRQGEHHRARAEQRFRLVRRGRAPMRAVAEGRRRRSTSTSRRSSTAR